MNAEMRSFSFAMEQSLRDNQRSASVRPGSISDRNEDDGRNLAAGKKLFQRVKRGLTKINK